MFNTSERKARNVKKLVSELEILTLPNPKTLKELTPESETLVEKFYERDDISRMMPGMKYFLSVKDDDGNRSHICKLERLHGKSF